MLPKQSAVLRRHVISKFFIEFPDYLGVLPAVNDELGNRIFKILKDMTIVSYSILNISLNTIKVVVLSSNGVIYAISADMESGSGKIYAEYRFNTGDRQPTEIHMLDSTTSIIICHMNGSLSVLHATADGHFESEEIIDTPGSRISNLHSVFDNGKIYLFFSRFSDLETLTFVAKRVGPEPYNVTVALDKSSSRTFETNSLPFISIR